MGLRDTAHRLKGAVFFAAALGMGFALSGSAGAQQSETPPAAAPAAVAAAPIQISAPADPIAKAAFEVLDKHCSRCHQEGKLSVREKPAKNFGNVLKLDEMASDPHYVLPGNPFGSKLLKQIVDKEMPYDVIYEGASFPDITEGEIKTLEAWIQSLGTKTAASCESRKFVRHEDVINFILADLEKQPRARKKGMRYLTLTHLKNACTDDVAMNVYRQGAIKLVNSLSRSPDVVRLEPIDPEGTILRINLDDLGWEEADWNTLLKTYPYNTQPDTELIAVLERSTGTKMPYARADWFAFAASRPSDATPAGLYDKLLKLPKTFDELVKEHGVDIEGNIKKFIAQRSGFQKSGVSRNNRLIERHPSRNGYFWTSYDFAGNKGKQSLFEHPLGPKGDNAFTHDGGESIFSLPNGFQAYYLNTADGKSLATGPTAIVQDPTSKDLSVTNGISCMGCHDQGMRKAKDEVRAAVLAGRAFAKDTRETVEALYPPTEKMDGLIAGDAQRFADAMKRAGLDPSLKLNGIEMITALMKRYENDLDINLAAAEMSMTKAEFAEAGREASRSFRTLIRRLEQGSIPRDQFEAQYASLTNDISDEEIVSFGDDKVAAKPAAKPAVKAKVAADISITSDKDAYKRNETIVFTVVASKDCFLTVTDVDEKGFGTVLFPNKFVQENKIKAGVEVQLPPKGAPFQYRLKDPGTETVTAVCAEKKEGVDGIKHDFARSAFTSTGNYSTSVARTRAIAVEVASGQAKPAPKPTTAERELFRTAVKIKVQ